MDHTEIKNACLWKGTVLRVRKYLKYNGPKSLCPEYTKNFYKQMRKHCSSFLTNRACKGIASSCKYAQPTGHVRPTRSPEGPQRKGPPASSTAEDESSWSSHGCWQEWNVAQQYTKLALPNQWDTHVTSDVVDIQKKHAHMCAERYT